VNLPPAIANLQRKHWLIIIAALALALTAMFAWFAWSALGRLGHDDAVPSIIRRQETGSLFAQIDETMTQIAAQNAIAAKLEERKAVLASMRADMEKARKRLPTEAEKTGVRQLIEDLARQVGSAANPLQVKSVSIRESAATGGSRGATGAAYKTLEFQTAITADMDGLIQYINLIERNERFMTVESISIAGGKVTLDRATSKVVPSPHAINLRIVTYIDTSAVAAGPRK
jgi:Tfp pilus assembly protein PilO